MSGTASREWGLLLKIHVPSGGAPPDRDQLARILAALPGADKKLTGGGSDFTISWWVTASDAATATRTGADTLRALARAEGLPVLHVIRAHAASVEGRYPAFVGTEKHLNVPKEWAVDLKAAAPSGQRVGTEVLHRMREAINRSEVAVTFRGDKEKFLLDDGSGFTVRFWTAGRTPPEAFSAARRDTLTALRRVGLGDWRIVRFKAGTPHHAHEDTFPGASSRIPSVTEEIR